MEQSRIMILRLHYLLVQLAQFHILQNMNMTQTFHLENNELYQME